MLAACSRDNCLCGAALRCLQVRTDAYQAALEGNPSLLSGATVLDVGCGTGILSMFAARGGAAAVVGEPKEEA